MSVDDQLQPLVSEFIAHLSEERQLSVHTVNCYKRDLTALQKELENQGITDWRDVSAHHLRTYIGGGKRQGRSGKTLQRSLSATRTFFNYLAREGVCTQNPAMEFSAPKSDSSLPVTIDTDQVSRLLEIDTTDWHALRDKAMLELFYSSGLRLTELVGSNKNDISFEENSRRGYYPLARKPLPPSRPGCKFVNSSRKGGLKMNQRSSSVSEEDESAHETCRKG